MNEARELYRSRRDGYLYEKIRDVTSLDKNQNATTMVLYCLYEPGVDVVWYVTTRAAWEWEMVRDKSD
jgi:hypothetical protein